MHCLDKRMLKRFLKLPGIPSEQERAQSLENEMIRKEGKIGGTLFGPTPHGLRREFFCLDEYTWVWHEEWNDKGGNHRVRNTRYDIRPDGIVKSQNGKHYQRISQKEAARLLDAAHAYEKRVRRELYSATA